jgi:alkyldihydroxyacetonephosphate synthase
MLYEELNPNINYARENLRWDAWGAHNEDFFMKVHLPEIYQNLLKEWNLSSFPKTPGVSIDEISLKPSRLTKADLKALQKIVGEAHVKDSRYERVFHGVGRSYYDVIRLRFNLVKEFPDVVVYPSSDEEIQSILEFCGNKKFSVIPFGGGSSVVGGVESIRNKTHKAILTMDLTRMDQLIELDSNSRTATFEAGIYGPRLEKILNDKGFTLGHFPQSFEYSTLGGWIAARSSGQQSGKYGRIDKILNSLRFVTSSGVINTLKAPPSSIGPDLNQIIAGSEGLLGVISRVTVKIHPLPQARKYFGILFPNFSAGAEFIREANLKNLRLSMMRLSDEDETHLFSMMASLGKKNTVFRKVKYKLINKVLEWNGIRDIHCAMIAGIDASVQEIEEALPRIKYLAEKHGGFFAGENPGKNWLKARFNMPFLRNHFLENGIGVDTLETAITYDRLIQLHGKVISSIRKVLPKASIMCHISHSYHEGASLYFTIIFPLDTKNPVEQWFMMKKAASDAIVEVGGSISHHHGVGADHKVWYQKQIDKTSLQGLKSLKKIWDSKNVLNPGKLFD